MQVSSMLSSAKLIFWDFDGVIKDSVEVKTDAYTRLFLPYGEEVSSRVKRHHEVNGGMSRFDKIPLYLLWAGEIATPELISEFCGKFSSLVFQAVIDAPWVPGVREYLLINSGVKNFVLVTATPQDEIQKIIELLEIDQCFREVHGAPKQKTIAIKEVLSRLKFLPENALMIGDAETDLQAAKANSVPFLLRCTPLNLSIQSNHNVPTFYNLNYE